MILSIASDGTLTAIYTEALDLDAIGTATIQRASHVDPTVGGWCAQIVSGPLLGPFHKRSEALAAEVDWIEKNVL